MLYSVRVRLYIDLQPNSDMCSVACFIRKIRGTCMRRCTQYSLCLCNGYPCFDVNIVTLLRFMLTLLRDHNALKRIYFRQ